MDSFLGLLGEAKVRNRCGQPVQRRQRRMMSRLVSVLWMRVIAPQIGQFTGAPARRRLKECRSEAPVD